MSTQKPKRDCTQWKAGDVVELYPNFFVKIVEIKYNKVGYGISYTSEPLFLPATRWQRIKAFFGWRPTVGY